MKFLPFKKMLADQNIHFILPGVTHIFHSLIHLFAHCLFVSSTFYLNSLLPKLFGTLYVVEIDFHRDEIYLMIHGFFSLNSFKTTFLVFLAVFGESLEHFEKGFH